MEIYLSYSASSVLEVTVGFFNIILKVDALLLKNQPALPPVVITEQMCRGGIYCCFFPAVMKQSRIPGFCVSEGEFGLFIPF